MNLLQRIQLDWQEYWDDQKAQWMKRRDARNIRRTIKQASLNSLIDGKTYYIMRDPTGNPHAFRSQDLGILKKAGWIDRKMNIHDVYRTCIAKVTPTGVQMNDNYKDK